MKRFPKNKKDLKDAIDGYIMTPMGTSLDLYISQYSDPRPRKMIVPNCKDDNHCFKLLTKDECESLFISYDGVPKWGCIKCYKVVISM